MLSFIIASVLMFGAAIKDGPVSIGNQMTFRSIGPAVTSGRVIAFAVSPKDSKTYFVASAYGGVWKTVNNGTTFTPVFDNEGSCSIGAVAVAPTNPNVVWVGTGECNAQRSVGWGDGVYRSDDGGKSWRNMGLKTSEHIARIAIDPSNADVVYVAAQGPLWGPGGERGLYKTTDGGKTWKAVLTVSENTGITDVVLDPRDPNVLYAASWQRRRHVYTYIGGGPESRIYRSADGGQTWTKLAGGLPWGDMGRIGLAISPADPDYLYATIEASDGASGIYRSTDHGASWEKRGDTVAQGMYYGQIVCDPKDPERVYIPSFLVMVSTDGGKSAQPIGERNKHVDNHAFWVDPTDTRHYLAGCDGGAYESFDRGSTWIFKSNLPITQFYRVTADNSKPFYYVYGGTQDNNSMGGPSRTKNPEGILNSDWFMTTGGDGFQPQVDPADPMTVYTESQDGGLERFDRRTGLAVGIQPVPAKGEPALRWYWDSPLIISPHSHTRLYFGGNILFRSDDRGDTWKPVSPDLTRRIDPATLKVFGQVPKMDAVARGQSTSYFGNIISLSESPLREGLIYAGTDDGLIQVTEDGGKNWRKVDKVEGVPAMTYVGRLLASRHDSNTVYALFDNHKNSDFSPYAMKSIDRGATWTSVAGDLPKDAPALCIAEDPAQPGLLFVGTEAGLYYTVNGGTNWKRMRGGLPTVAVRDVVIQSREGDLVIGTFGRGIYILDDYTPLRHEAELEDKAAAILPIRDAYAFVPFGGGTGSQGETRYEGANPPYGVTISYYVKDVPKSLRQKREAAEAEIEKKGETPPYPSAAQLRAEADEQPAALVLTVSDAKGEHVKTIVEPASTGFHRLTWDMRGPGFSVPIGEPTGGRRRRRGGGGAGFQVMPGEYRVSLSLREGAAVKELVGATPFRIVGEGEERLSEGDRQAIIAYREKVSRLQRTLTGALATLDDLTNRIGTILTALEERPTANVKLREEALGIEAQLDELARAFRGDSYEGQLGHPTPPSLVDRANDVTFSQLTNPIPPTGTRRDSLAVALAEFAELLPKLRKLALGAMPALESKLDKAGVLHTPGRVPDWP